MDHPHLIGAIARHGYVLILVIMIIEETGIPMPIPGDGLLIFAGYLCSIGALSIGGSVAIVVLGALVGATVLYWVSRRGGRALVHKYGKYVRLDERRLDQLRGLFERLGSFGPGVARLIPGLRIYTSALAGLADIPYPIFILNVLWAGVAWSLCFLLIGYYFGNHWRDYLHLTHRFTLLTLMAGGLLLAGYIWLHRRKRIGRRSEQSSLGPSN
jgi:membrane protein DedA with SNARE-associated domain